MEENRIIWMKSSLNNTLDKVLLEATKKWNISVAAVILLMRLFTQCKIRELKAVEIPHFEDEPAEDADTEDDVFPAHIRESF